MYEISYVKMLINHTIQYSMIVKQGVEIHIICKSIQFIVISWSTRLHSIQKGL